MADSTGRVAEIPEVPPESMREAGTFNNLR
jgi:hypothetical protein